MGIKTIPAFITEGRDLAYQTFSNPKYLSPLTQEEFKQLFDNYFDPIRNYIYYRSGNKELATDVTQEVFLRIWEKQPLIINGNAKALLYKIAGDIFVSEYRKQKTAAAFKVATAKNDSDTNSPEQQIQFKETYQRYEEALSQLSENQRVVFLMHRMDGLKYHEIAVSLGLSIKAVEKRMSIAISYLRKVIERE